MYNFSSFRLYCKKLCMKTNIPGQDTIKNKPYMKFHKSIINFQSDLRQGPAL